LPSPIHPIFNVFIALYFICSCGIACYKNKYYLAEK
jgi:hypothetical protein